MVGAALIPMTPDPGERASLAALLALLVGAAYLVALLARLGWIADYLSRPVLIGYIHGVAVVMIVGQLGKLLGLSISAESPPGQVVEVIQEIGQVNLATVAVGGSCLVLLLLARWLAPKLPAPLIVVVLAIAASAALGLAGYGVAVVGEIPAGLPSISLPDLHLRAVLDVLPAALGIFFVSFSDEILVARSFAGRHGQHVRADAELAGHGRCQPRRQHQPGDADRRERLAHRGQRPDGRPHAVLRSAGRRRRRLGAVVPHRPHAVPAQGDARRGHRVRLASG